MIRRPRQSWATRPLPPLTAADLEDFLDMVAQAMAKAGRKADLYLPVYRRIERELEKRRDDDATIAAAMARLTRSRDRTEALS